MKKFWLILLVFGLVAGAGCGDDDDFGDDDYDTDTDETDTATDADCPIDSGYPCTCNTANPTCLDGSDCIFLEENAPLGMCAKACTGYADETSCVDTLGYGVPDPPGPAGACVWGPASTTESTNCGVICESEGATGPCPPGQTCMATESYGVCTT